MNFLFDENFPKSARAVFERWGHEVFDFRRLEIIGSPDEAILGMAFENAAAVLTTDRNYFHTLGRRYPNHHGIVVIALRQPNRHSIISSLEWFPEQINAELLESRAFQLRDKPWKVYLPLDSISPCA